LSTIYKDKDKKSMPLSSFSLTAPAFDAIDAILVPQGSEFNAVKQGLMSLKPSQPLPPSQPSKLQTLQAIPVGPDPLRAFLRDWHPAQPLNQPPRVLVMGLCGALTPTLRIGDAVLYDTCTDGIVPDYSSIQPCDVKLCKEILQKLERDGAPPIAGVRALTTAAVVSRATDKAALAQASGADVVDMEGWVALNDLRQRGMAVAMVRVVSDDCQHDLPDLSAAFSPTGQLLPLPLALGMMRQPRGALRLIRGSLTGLKKLEQLTTALFC
jgi:hypothetical protein